MYIYTMFPITYRPEIAPSSFAHVSDPGMQDWIQKTFKYSKTDSHHDLFTHQRLVRDYMQIDSPYRGLLLYHAVGVGKTRSAIAIMEALVNEKKVIIMLPAALQTNFVEEIHRYGNQFYVRQQHWKKIDGSQIQIQKHIPYAKELLSSNGVVWTPTSDRKANYLALSPDDRGSIEKQMKFLISKRIKFIRYNGLQRKKVDAMLQRHPHYFDNTLVIIDEVHNFISRVVSGSFPARLIYKHLLEAKLLKLVCLSGTPLLNYPIEFSLLMNMLAGYLTTHTINCRSAFFKDPANLKALQYTLSNTSNISSYEIDNDKRQIMITGCPPGFARSSKSMMLTRTATEQFDIQVLIDNLDLPLLKTEFKTHTTTLFPLSEKAFRRLLNFKATTTDEFVLDKRAFMSKINGLISYFSYYDPKTFPSQSDLHIVKVDMTAAQRNLYGHARLKEDPPELDVNDPKKIPPKTTKNMLKNLNSDKYLFKEFYYFKTISRGILNCSLNEEDTWSDWSDKYLREYAPKYAKMLSNINKSHGPVLIYSQYRNTKGIRRVQQIMEFKGYARLSIGMRDGDFHLKCSNSAAKNRYIEFSNQNPVKMRLLLDLFNGNYENLPLQILQEAAELCPDYMKAGNTQGSLAKVMMITSSGAEGISLKNVRQVHMTEPYWNYIRIEQVIGRAVRAKSHLLLPKQDQHVDVYMYMVQFSKEQQAENKKNNTFDRDSGLTTDEMLFRIANRKRMMLNGLLNLMKSGAVDCKVHEKVHQIIDKDHHCTNETEFDQR